MNLHDARSSLRLVLTLVEELGQETESGTATGHLRAAWVYLTMADEKLDEAQRAMEEGR